MKSPLNRKYLALFLPLSQILFFSPAFAQDPRSFLIRPWAVGQSITLQTCTYKNENLTDVVTRTYSIVGQETVKGKKYFWMEMEQAKQDGTTLIVKTQVRQPGPVDFENYIKDSRGLMQARRRIVQKGSAGSPPIEKEVSADAVSQIENAPELAKTEDLSKDFRTVQSQPLTVVAGIFKATEFYVAFASTTEASSANGSESSSQTGTVPQFIAAWGAPEIPIWGLVQKTTQRVEPDHTVVIRKTKLVSFKEKGAESKIKNSPLFEKLEGTTNQ